MKKRAVAFILLLVLLVGNFSVLSFASSEKAQDYGDVNISFSTTDPDDKDDDVKGFFEYVLSNPISLEEDETPPETDEYGNPLIPSEKDEIGISEYYYRDSYFFSPSGRYNSHLATLSKIVSMVSSARADRGYSDKYVRAKSLFADMGFEQIEVNDETDGSTTPDTMGTVIAKKSIAVSGEPYTLVAVCYRSGGYGAEWASNFLVGTSDECPEGHLGFHRARDRALEFILDYLERNVSGNLKLWISGFSRGGAVSGLTGVWFNDNTELLSEYGITLKDSDIFTYTFEAPASISAELNKQKNYDNIFNVINKNDLIPLVPFKLWGLERPGQIHYLTDFTEENVGEVIQILEKLNPGLEYTSHLFKPYRPEVGANQAEFINNMCDTLASRLDRNTYAEKVENTLYHVLDTLLNYSEEELKAIFTDFGTSVADAFESFLGQKNEIQKALFIRNLLNCNASEVGTVCDIVGEKLEEYRFVEVYDEETKEALQALLTTVLYTDDGVSFVPYFLTIMSGANIIEGHLPEIILASLIYEDSYYKASADISWAHGFLSKDDSVTVTVNDGKRVYNVTFKKGAAVSATASASGCLEIYGWYFNGEFINDDNGFKFIADANSTLRAVTKIAHRGLGEWKIEKEALGFFEGRAVLECSLCGERRVEVIEAPLDLHSPITLAAGAVTVSAFLIICTFICVQIRKSRERKAKEPEKAEENASN